LVVVVSIVIVIGVFTVFVALWSLFAHSEMVLFVYYTSPK